MDRLQLNKQEMGTSVAQTMASNEPLFKGLPVVKSSSDLHNENIATIAKLAVDQQNAKEIKGLIHDKNMLRQLIIINVTRIINGIVAFAKSENNEQLAQAVHYTDSFLRNTSDAKALAAFEKVLEVAVANSAAIAPYGVSAGMITLLTNDSESFSQIIQKPKSMRSTQKLITENLQKAVSGMVNHLKDSLDKLMRANFLDTDFASAYFLSRRVYNTGTPATSLSGYVKDDNGHAIKKAMVEILDYPTAGTNTARFTDGKGYFAFKRLDMTQATLRCRALNYADKEMIAQLKKEKENKVEFVVVPAVEPVLV